MFRNKTRARIPSSATVQVLYQLAYISSGTAVGVAALCAEERRRRTLILQKIADNARRIRQSPRHVHNAALAQSEEPAEWIPEDPGAEVTDSSGNVVPRGYVATGVVARGAGLPSAVEKGYDQLLAMGARRPQPSDFPVDENLQGRLYEAPYLRHTKSQPSSEHFKTRDVAYREYRRGGGRRLRLVGETRAQKGPGPSASRSQPDFCTLKVPDGDLSHLATDVKSDVDLFFQSQPWSRRGIIQEVRVADHLITKTLQYGLLSEARSVYEWKLHRIGLSNQDLRQICAACSHLAGRQDREVILEFYIDFLTFSNFTAAPVRLQHELAFGLVAEMLTWDLPLTNRQLIDVLLDPIISVSGQGGGRVSSDALHDALDAAVRGLLAKGCIDAAAELLVRTSMCDHQLAVTLADLIFDAARQANRLTPCQKILKWEYTHHQRQETLTQQYEWFIRTCDEQRAHQMLHHIIRSLTNTKWFNWLVTRLSIQARLVLATACTVQNVFPRNTFTKLYDEIPNDVNESLSEVHSTLQLEKLWSTTRDLKAVRSLFDELRCKRTSADKECSGISITMVEILCVANQPDEALDFLQELCSSRIERTRLACLAAEAMARKKRWGRVDELLGVISKRKDFWTHATTSDQLNRIARLFCRQHGSQESWNYMTSLMRKFGFRPHKSTIQTLLQCFVNHESLDMILPCLRHLRDQGVNFIVDTEIAATLLSVYCWLQQPTHTLMMELCRNLITIAPWLDRTKLIRVIEEAIACDLRNASGKNKNKIIFWAERNLTQLEELDGPGLPAPSWLFEVDSLAEKTSCAVDPKVLARVGERRRFESDDEFSTNKLEEGYDDVRPGESQRRRRKLEQEMVLAWSSNNDDEVLALYRDSLDANGLPQSPVILEIATQSALRRCKDDSSEALALLKDAQAAGMNISCAMGPLLIHQMHHPADDSNREANHLRTAVIDYYRSNEENGWKVRHSVGISAANLLCERGRPSYAINLLNAIYYSHWASDRPLDIVAMTVYLKSYVALNSIQGISWVVNKVLHGNIRIDRRFTDALKESLKHFGSLKSRNHGGSETDEVKHIRKLREECLTVERKQRRAAKAFGIELVQCLAKCSIPDMKMEEKRGLSLQKPIDLRYGQFEDSPLGV